MIAFIVVGLVFIVALLAVWGAAQARAQARMRGTAADLRRAEDGPSQFSDPNSPLG